MNSSVKRGNEIRTLAELYYKLSIEEMKHVDMLHEEVVRVISEYKKTNEVPAGMQAIYDYVHEREIQWASKIKYKQSNFR